MTSRPPINGGADEPLIERAPWLTQRRLVVFVFAWLLLFALISALVSNPFQSERSASSGPDTGPVMFLHGLLIGTVGLGALLACQGFGLRSRHVRVGIAFGVLAATIPAAIGGLFIKQIPGDEVPMWIQIAGFFALDEIFIMLLVGLVGEWRRSVASRTLPFLAATLATASMLCAALMGHLGGWILEFGNSPGLIGRWANQIGTDTKGWAEALVGAHSHQMVVALMAFIVALAAQQFGYGSLEGSPRSLARGGLAAVAVGIVWMSGIYLANGLFAWNPPAWFTSHHGTNGIASDDVVTGVLVMGGGVLVLFAYLLVGAGKLASLRGRPLRLAAIWTWGLSFATVAVAGYAIELNETYFGAGDPSAAGASKDAVYTWLHQDIGLFLLPTLTLVMLAVERFVAARHHRVIGRMTLLGATVAFLGALIWVFIDPAIHGAGYVISTAGLAIVGAALLAALWWGAIEARRTPAAAAGAG